MQKELFKGGKFPFRLPFKPIVLGLDSNAKNVKLLFPSTASLTPFTSDFCHRRLQATRSRRRDPPVFQHSSVGHNPFPPNSIALAEVIVSIPRRSASRLIMLPALHVPLPQRVRRWPIYQDSAPPAPRLARVSTCISLAAFSAAPTYSSKWSNPSQRSPGPLSRLRRHVFFSLRRSRVPSSERYSCFRLQDGS